MSGARDTCQAGINDRYVYVQQYNGKTVYSLGTSLYLFWNTEALWKICSGIEFCSASAYAGTTGAGPTNLNSGQWFEYCNDAWTIGSIVISPDCSV